MVWSLQASELSCGHLERGVVNVFSHETPVGTRRSSLGLGMLVFTKISCLDDLPLIRVRAWILSASIVTLLGDHGPNGSASY